MFWDRSETQKRTAMGTDRLPVEMTSYAEDCGMNCAEAMSPRRLLLVNAGAARAFVLLCEATEEPL